MGEQSGSFLPHSRPRGSREGLGARRPAAGEEREDVVQLRVQMLMRRLGRQRGPQELEKASPALSRSKTSKVTFGRREPASPAGRLRELKERRQNEF